MTYQFTIDTETVGRLISSYHAKTPVSKLVLDRFFQEVVRDVLIDNGIELRSFGSSGAPAKVFGLDERRVVRGMRKRKASWTEVGKAFGMSAQTAELAYLRGSDR